jgi:hypothetical protein
VHRPHEQRLDTRDKAESVTERPIAHRASAEQPRPRRRTNIGRHFEMRRAREASAFAVGISRLLAAAISPIVAPVETVSPRMHRIAEPLLGSASAAGGVNPCRNDDKACQQTTRSG